MFLLIWSKNWTQDNTSIPTNRYKEDFQVSSISPWFGSSGYKFYDDLNTYEKRCLNDDPTGSKLVFPEAEEEIVELEVYLSELKESKDGIDSEKDIIPRKNCHNMS